MNARASQLTPPGPPIPMHTSWTDAPVAVLHTAAAVRHALVALQPHTTWSRSLCGACGTATLVLGYLLRRQGFEPIPVTGLFFPRDGQPGCSHAWLLLDDMVLDVTATQFGALPEVYVRSIGTRSRQGEPFLAEQHGHYEPYHVGALARHDMGTWASHVETIRHRAQRICKRWTLAQLTTWEQAP